MGRRPQGGTCRGLPTPHTCRGALPPPVGGTGCPVHPRACPLLSSQALAPTEAPSALAPVLVPPFGSRPALMSFVCSFCPFSLSTLSCVPVDALCGHSPSISVLALVFATSVGAPPLLSLLCCSAVGSAGDGLLHRPGVFLLFPGHPSIPLPGAEQGPECSSPLCSSHSSSVSTSPWPVLHRTHVTNCHLTGRQLGSSHSLQIGSRFHAESGLPFHQLQHHS